ncbi:MAG: Asp23/Gls24 family envelope stress response protein [Eubacteriales bacterium]|nr:Asp23/Gls24 family envelope stress response protein [Eubacteriales bacterium]
MEQDGKKTYTVETNAEIGTVKIADDVVSMIAAFAAMEVDGVSAMAGNLTMELLGKAGFKNLNKGVKVEVSEGRVRVALSLIMAYGYNIPVTSSQVQTRVKTAIENMTGLTVTDVNIRIAGINVAKDK